MHAHHSALVALLALCVTDAALAAPKFDSSYTHLGKDCVEMPQPEEYAGQDPAFDCKGPDGLHARLYFSAADALLVVLRPVTHSTDEVLDSLIDGVNGIDTQKGVLEWRLADGRPYAIIMRSRPVEFDDAGVPKAGGVETLEVRSIQPHPSFTHSIHVRSTPEANKRARELADGSWRP